MKNSTVFNLFYNHICALRNEFDLMLFKNLQETLNYGIKIGMEIKEFTLTKDI